MNARLPDDSFREAAAQGLTIKEAATKLGVHYCTVQTRAKKLGIKFTDARWNHYERRKAEKE